jgi:hypothetical protein
MVRVYSKKLYDEVKGFINRHEVGVDTKYKTIAKKIILVALPLPSDCEENVERRLGNIETAIKMLKETKVKNKDRFDCKY